MHRQNNIYKPKKLKAGGFTPTTTTDGIGSAAGALAPMADLIFPENSVGGAAATGALSGASTGAAFGPIGMGVGAVIGGGIGALNQSKINKDKRALEAKQKAEFERAVYMQKGQEDVANLQNYAGGYGRGVQNYSSFMKDGGKITKPEYEAEKGEVVQGKNIQLEEQTNLGNDLVKVEGRKHEQGGTMGKGGEKIYSDSIKPNNETMEYFNTKYKGKFDSYAQIAEKLGRISKKYDDDRSDTREASKTKNLMKAKYDRELDMLFEEQESSKVTNGQTMKYGGRLPKYNTGGELEYNKWLKEKGYDKLNVQNVVDRDAINNSRMEYNDYLKTNNQTNDWFTENRPYANNKNLVRSGEEDLQRIPSLLERKPANPELIIPPGKTMEALGSGVGQPPKKYDWEAGAKAIDKVAPQIINGVNYFQNKRDIAKIQTDLKPVTLGAAKNNYVDRSGLSRYDNQTSVKQTQQFLNSTSSQANNSQKAMLNSKLIDGENQINNQENSRRDMYNENLDNKNIQISSTNAQIINTNRETNLGRNNEKIKLGTDNRNAFFQGFAANRYEDRLADTDKLRLNMMQQRYATTGVGSRFDVGLAEDNRKWDTENLDDLTDDELLTKGIYKDADGKKRKLKYEDISSTAKLKQELPTNKKYGGVIKKSKKYC